MPVIFDGGTDEPRLITTCPHCGEQGGELVGQPAMLPGRRMFHCRKCRQDYMEQSAAATPPGDASPR